MANDTERTGGSEQDGDRRCDQDTQTLDAESDRSSESGSSEDGETGDGGEQLDFEQLFQRWVVAIRHMLGREFPSLRRADAEDILQEVRKALLERIAMNPGILEEKGARSLVLAIARNKASDILRRKERDRRKNERRQTVLDSQCSLWTKMTSIEQTECMAIILEIADTLTAFEQFVWEAYVEHYPRSRRCKYLADVTGMPLESRQISKILAGVRKKFLHGLRTKGYDLDG